MIVRLPSLILLCALLVGSTLLRAAPLTIRAPSGATLQVDRQLPEGPGPFPAVVLAPGQGYHMGLPAMEQSSAALVRRGIAVFRFNWGYFTSLPRGSPSESLAVEIDDMRAVLAHVRADASIDATRVVLAGKSLGSIVAWRLFRSETNVAGVVLMTPICATPKAGQDGRDEYYAGFRAEGRPVALVLGDEDPLCPVTELHKWALTA